MEGRSLFETIDFAKHDFSLVLVDPKPSMLDWLGLFVKQKGLQRYRLYYPEGGIVVVVPKLDYFSTYDQFEQFVDRMKPRLLREQLGRFTATPEDFGRAMTKETFDEFLNLSVRESALLMSDFGDPEQLCMVD